MFPKYKIIGSAIIVSAFGALFLAGLIFFNAHKKEVPLGNEVKAQEAMDVTLVCEGDEIPLGELVEEVLASGKVIVDSLDLVGASGADQVEAAKQLFALPEECKAENCTPGCVEESYPCDPYDCVVGGITPEDKFASTYSPGKGLLLALDSITSFKVETLGFLLAQAGCDPVVCGGFGGICCGATCVKWWEDNNNCGSCGHVCNTGSCRLNIPGDYLSGADCWGTCWNTCTRCVTSPCTGDACPWTAISDKVSFIQGLYGNISNSQNLIETEMDKRDDYLKTLDEVREKLAKCVTPSLKELNEAEIKEAKVLYTCQEAAYERALPSGKEACDNPNNFVCCYFE